MKTTDVLVIGAGPSGSVAAAIIHNAGFKVLMVEKQKFPRFVIGESLLPRCLDALESAGLLEAVKKQNFQVKCGAKFVRQGAICDFTFDQQFTRGRQNAWQMPRADFDLALASECQRKGIELSYESEVTNITFEKDGSSITTIQPLDGRPYQVKARFIVDGSGYGRVIPRLFNLERNSSQPPRRALLTHMSDPHRLRQEEPNRIVIYVHKDDCWIWTIPFNNGKTSVGFVSSPEFFDGYSGTPEEMLRAMIKDEPELAERFEGSTFSFAPKTLKNWSATTDVFYGKGFVLTGNVTEFLDPIFSSGVTLATVSAERAATLAVKQLNGETIDWDKEYQQYMMRGVSVFRTYVNAWYDHSLFRVFFAEGKDEKVKSQICSVLAGYVWDLDNPFVKNHEKSLQSLIKFIIHSQVHQQE